MTDPIDEAAARATNLSLETCRTIRLAILRGMLERPVDEKWKMPQEPFASAWRAMLSAEIDQLTKESP